MSSIYILVDRSPSMWRPFSSTLTRIDAAKRFVEKLLEHLYATHGASARVFIYVFPSTLKGLSVDLVASKSLLSPASIKSLMRMFEDALVKVPTTPMLEAIRDVLLEARRGSNIVVITDGEFTSARDTIINEIKELIDTRSIKLDIVVTGLSYSTAASRLKAIGAHIYNMTLATVSSERQLLLLASKIAPIPGRT